MGRKGRDPEELRQKIIDVAQNIIATEGLRKCTVRAITKKAGCALGALGYLFTGLDDVVLAVNTRTLREMGEYMFEQAQAEQREEVVDRLTALAVAYLTYAREYFNQWEALFAFRFSQGDLPTEYLEVRGNLLLKITTLFSKDMQDKEKNIMLARTMYEAVHGIVVLGLDSRLGGTNQDVENRIRLLVLTMMK
ncbi:MULTISPECIES: TetR/AcrR family transcriptional regulator [Commensalibacter]|uniref:TetR family transcriptional regulator n=2 Tax=Commensalibacter TaxID=1079922 RepID=W7E4B9_9PROT|nr:MULTISPECIES: WHG domain-containing protein [Commensalibacter]EUK17921.1 TetR family transcriptional regulator [Commensalibacter papalotli (ex Servin-Garciduenas et al. 2014)]CAI3941736.1 AcrR family [Commensalibacter papalotli (ex Botero et al. 2024)]CAI3949232.1 AcrR family [Commensalibacter papalotli (ex Botero et al. 2024)]